jgi:hypothetical protein
MNITQVNNVRQPIRALDYEEELLLSLGLETQTDEYFLTKVTLSGLIADLSKGEKMLQDLLSSVDIINKMIKDTKR